MRAPYSRTLFDLLCEQAERYPDRDAVVGSERTLSYSQLLARVSGVAGGLRARGVARHDRVGLLLDNRPEWIEICFGAVAIGAVLVPFSTWSKRRELEFLFKDSRIKVLFAADKVGEQDFAQDLAAMMPSLAVHAPGAWREPAYPALETMILVGKTRMSAVLEYESFATAQPPLAEPLAPGDGARTDDPALILYTSGSTSYPKAVPLTHASIIENGFNIGERQGLTPEDRVLLSPPLFWSYGSANAMLAALGHGAALVLQGRFEAGEALDLIERQRVTSLYTMPGMTAAMLTHKDFRRERTRTLRTGVTIGTPQDVATVANELGAREICNIYGQTESCGNCAVTPHHWPLERRMRVQGPPLPGVQIRIVDEATGAPVAQGTPGQIEVKGNVTPGYDGKSAENNTKAFTADGFFRTGDLGLLTPEGDVQFLARTTEMIKRAGINIAPAEVEEVLRKHDGVAEVGVVGAPDPDKGEIVLAFVVGKPDARLTEEMLRAHCRAEAASYKTPDRIEIRDSLPTTATGKLMRSELKTLAAKLPPRSRER
jgi:fatty-acyl-CoA synthase